MTRDDSPDDEARISLMRDFLCHLFSPYESDGYVELRAIGGKYPETSFLSISDLWDDMESVRAAYRWAESLDYSQGKAIYFGVLPRNERRGKEEFISRAAYIWADVDFKTIGEQAGFDAVFKGAYAPDVVVHSGNGLHAYYSLPSPFAFETKARREAFKVFVETIQQKIVPGMDPVKDTARVMRLPGFFNRKDPASPKFVSVLKSPEIK